MAAPDLSSLTTQFASGLMVPPHDYQAFTYISLGAANDDNVATITFKQGGASGRTIAVQTFTYVGSTNNVATVTLTLPTAP